MVEIISVVIGDHFGGGDHFDGGDHFGGGTGYHKTLSATIACDRTSCETDPFERLS